MHEAKIRRELILNNTIHWDYEVSIHVPIESSIHEKKHVFGLTLEEVFFENKP